MLPDTNSDDSHNTLLTDGRTLTDAARFLELTEKAKSSSKGQGPALTQQESDSMNSYRDWVLTTSKAYKPE